MTIFDDLKEEYSKRSKRYSHHTRSAIVSKAYSRFKRGVEIRWRDIQGYSRRKGQIPMLNDLLIEIPKLKLVRNKEITFQVKRKQEIKKQKADYTISLADRSNISEKQHFLTPKWVFEVIIKQQKTKEWIENSLRWFIEDTDYNSIFDLIHK